MDIQSTISGKHITLTLKPETPLEQEILYAFKDRATIVKVEDISTNKMPLMIIYLGNGKEISQVS